MKALVSILIAALAVLAILVWTDHQQLADLRTAVAAAQGSDTKNQTEKCAAQSEKVFLGYGYKINSADSHDDFQSHFNRALNKCFVVIDTRSSKMRMRMLLDAYERRGYGELTTAVSSRDGLPYKSVVECVVDQDSNAKQDCKTEDEYNKLTAKYWQQ